MSGIPSWCRKGTRVVCINADDIWEADGVSRLVCGAEYIIEAVDASASWGVGPVRHGVGVHIVGANRRCGMPYGVFRFRPLVTLEDDITTYFADLLDVREPVGA